MGLKNILYTICLLVAFAPSSWGQKIKLKRANALYGGVTNGERYDHLIGNVVFKQGKATIYCDTAYFFKAQNQFNAFGKVHIVEGDSIDITALQLLYDGNSKLARLRNKVVFKKRGSMIMYTDSLNYYRHNGQAHYFNGGKLVDSTYTLTSEKGYYDGQINTVSFKENVVGISEEHTLKTDTLQYKPHSKVVFFYEHTTLVDQKNTTIVFDGGFYNTRAKISTLHNGKINTPSYWLKGDRLLLDDIKKLYKARGNVVMTSEKDALTVYGNNADYRQQEGITKVYDNAYMAKDDNQGDSLFIRADTLVSIEKEEDPLGKKMLAYNNVKIFKTNLSGVADSLAYIARDSMLYFFNQPALWMDTNQITSDSIHMFISNNMLERIYFITNPFAVLQDSLSHFNQVKGRNMVAYFKENQIDYMDVEGNVESLYFVLENDEEVTGDGGAQNKAMLMGMNRITCGHMQINFERRQVHNIQFYLMPEASFIPPQALKEEDIRLPGFLWRGQDKPAKKDVVGMALGKRKNP